MSKKNMAYMLIFLVASMIILIVLLPNESNPNLLIDADHQITMGFRRLYDTHDDDLYDFSSVIIYEFEDETYVAIHYEVLSEDPLVQDDLYIKISGNPPSWYFKTTEDLLSSKYMVNKFNEAEKNYDSKYELTSDEIKLYRSTYGL